MLTLPRAKQTKRTNVVRARYDAAQTTDENRRLWSSADGLDAVTCNNLGVRTILRNRCRYVFANNSRAKGMIRTLAKHTVGTGPTLQMALGNGKQARKLNAKVETSWYDWAREIKLAKKLRIMRIAKVISGEIFPILFFNPKLVHPVKLDVLLVEADQCTNPSPDATGDDADGVFFDEYNNPVRYRILTAHPGGMRPLSYTDYQDYAADACLHYFDCDRPGQWRGIPEITPAVQLVEEARRFRAAVLGAAETAADFAIALQSSAPPVEDATDPEVQPMDTFELQRRMATVLPQGWTLAQTKAEQPTTTFKEFQREILAEVARCLEIPVSVATLDANDANMSSSYVINQPYQTAIEVERTDIETDVLDRIFDRWLTMAFNPMGEAPLARRSPLEFPHAWRWPLTFEHADPAKVAGAEDTRLKNHSTTLAAVYARRGLDWETELEQRAKEKARMKELGLTEAEAMPRDKADTTGDETNEEEIEEELSD